MASAGGVSVAASGTKNGAIQRKLQKVLSMKLDPEADQDLISALAYISLNCDAQQQKEDAALLGLDSSPVSSSSIVPPSDAISPTHPLSGFKNTLDDRRNLRGNLERVSLDHYRQFFDEFSSIHKKLEDLQSSVDGISSSCQSAVNRVSSTRSSVSSLYQQAKQLKSDIRRTTKEQEVVEAFLHRFQPSTEDQTLLRVGSPSSPTFLQVLHRLRLLRNDCSRLLMGTRQQQTGMELLDQLSELQEVGYDRLYRWAQQECRQMCGASATGHPSSSSLYKAMQNSSNSADMEDYLIDIDPSDDGSMDPSPALRDALHVLSDRPVLLQVCLDEISAARKQVITRRFLSALKRGDRPMEMHAHDPIRYVGDMAAWLHQSVTLEADALSFLFSFANKNNPSKASPIPSSDSQSAAEAVSYLEKEAAQEQISKLCNNVLASIFEGVCKHVRTRVDGVLNTCSGGLLLNNNGDENSSLQSSSSSKSAKPANNINSDPVALFRLSGILEFYAQNMIGRSLDASSPLPKVLFELHKQAIALFTTVIRMQTDRIENSLPSISSSDLSIPKPLIELLHRFSEVAHAFASSSLLSLEKREENFAPVISTFIEPYTRIATNMISSAAAVAATMPSPLPSAHTLHPHHVAALDCLVFHINALLALQSTLSPFDFTFAKQQSVQSEIDALLDAVTKEQTSTVLQQSGLFIVASKLASYAAAMAAPGQEENLSVLSSEPGMDSDSVASVCRTLYASLFSLGSLLVPHLEKMHSPRLRADIRRRVAQNVVAVYDQLYDAVMEPRNDFSEPHTICYHTPQQVKVLLDCE